MAELTPYTPRSQMSMDLLKAISEPKMTAQDLAMQEEQSEYLRGTKEGNWIGC